MVPALQVAVCSHGLQACAESAAARMESIPPLVQLLIYVLYRLFRCVVQLESDLWLLAKRFWRSKAERATDELTPVEVGAIVLR